MINQNGLLSKVQIRPWNLADSDFVLDGSQPLDPRKTIFVGGVPRPLRAGMWHSEIYYIENSLLLVLSLYNLLTVDCNLFLQSNSP